MPDAVICEPLRTLVGRFEGALKDVPAQALAATVLTELLGHTRIAGEERRDPGAGAPQW